MTIAPGNARTASHTYRTMREFVQAMDDTLPGKFEITEEGIVHDMMSPAKSHELTALRIWKLLDKVLPEDLGRELGVCRLRLCARASATSSPAIKSEASATSPASLHESATLRSVAPRAASADASCRRGGEHLDGLDAGEADHIQGRAPTPTPATALGVPPPFRHPQPLKSGTVLPVPSRRVHV
ncbi:hypothetical protein ACFRAO_09510 [Streptomyces sp. NPDC056656]|uniref:hypothetical protein n=1 Tax=Streptomyces sp. NPDC056656 TaxID=3345895 RepID=UPI003695F5D7